MVHVLGFWVESLGFRIGASENLDRGVPVHALVDDFPVRAVHVPECLEALEGDGELRGVWGCQSPPVGVCDLGFEVWGLGFGAGVEG